MMKDILVIHPADPTTDCLCTIYGGREDCDIIRDPSTDAETIAKAIEDHGKILCLGHGTPEGLLAYDKGFRFGRFIINTSHKAYFENKQVWSIWCNSDQYFKDVHTSTRGIHTGMIISEFIEEKLIMGKAPLTVLEMNENMKVFSEAFRDNFSFENPDESRENILSMYTFKDEITEYNRNHILVF